MKAKWIVVAVLLAVVLAAGVGFGGYTLGVQAGTARAQSVRNNFLAARGLGGQGQAGAGQFQGQGGSGQFNANNFASGQVKSINGDTVTLSTATSVVTIKLGTGTQIQKMGPATTSDIQVGERITVQGTRGSDGSLAAESVQIGGGRGGAGAPAAAAPSQGSGTTN